LSAGGHFVGYIFVVVCVVFLSYFLVDNADRNSVEFVDWEAHAGFLCGYVAFDRPQSEFLSLLTSSGC